MSSQINFTNVTSPLGSCSTSQKLFTEIFNDYCTSPPINTNVYHSLLSDFFEYRASQLVTDSILLHMLIYIYTYSMSATEVQSLFSSILNSKNIEIVSAFKSGL